LQNIKSNISFYAQLRKQGLPDELIQEGPQSTGGTEEWPSAETVVPPLRKEVRSIVEMWV
jgi:hypothetical protein